MKYVPSLPPPLSGVGGRMQVTASATVHSVKPVQGRPLPSLGLQRQRGYPEGDTYAIKEIEKRQVDYSGVDRREYCRRTRHEPILIELRSGKDRRQHNQRGSDMMTHIDEEV